MPAPPKLHHYVPQVYLRSFTNDTGRLIAYRKDDPRNPHPKLPREVGAQNNYYAQPTPDGSIDRELEKLFHPAENAWPAILSAFAEGQQLSSELIEQFYQFIGGLRVRGPVSRDAAELIYAEQVRAAGEIMERRGDFPQPPAGLEEALKMKNLILPIDPHQSIHAMPHMLGGFSRVLQYLGFALIQNKTGVSLITSDNPIAYFDPTTPEDLLRPYAIENGPPIELLFPITPKLLVVGHSDWAGPGSHTTFRHLSCANPQVIRRANRYTARFGYKEVYAAERTHDALVAKWADQSPVVRNEALDVASGNLVVSQWVFGVRPNKPKWKGVTPPSA